MHEAVGKQMSKSSWIGVAAGIGVAVAGAAAAYTYLGEPPAKAPSAAQEDCWDEEVAAVADPNDPHRIAGTAVGREIQEKIQDNRAERRTAPTTGRRCAPIDSR
jgi:hypothetical protein